MKYDYNIFNGPNGDEFTVRVIFGERAADNFQDNDIANVREFCNGLDGIYMKRTFKTFEEAKAYMQGIEDMDGWNGYALMPGNIAEPCYLNDTENCKWVERMDFPEYAIPFLFGITSFEEYIDYYGENGKEDVENYKQWYERYLANLNLEDNQMLHFVLVEENAEHPTASFDAWPLFGKPCDSVEVDVYLITTDNGTQSTE